MNIHELLSKVRVPRISIPHFGRHRSTHRRPPVRPRVSGPGGRRGVGSNKRASLRRFLSIFGVVVSVLLLTAASVEAKPKEWTTICRHVVQPRESIYCIARAYGVSPTAIATHNGLSNPSLIYVGRVLAIPNAYASLPSGPTCPRQCQPATSCTCRAYHSVATGESLYRIGSRYGVSMWRIAECNKITNLNLIRVGAVLSIPSNS
jgi:LysM repeat protein